MSFNRRKIRNVGPTQEVSARRKDLDYLSPHCANGNCNWCRERARRKREAATKALEASAACAPGMFWDRPITRGRPEDQQLGPSTLWAKPAGGRRLIMDVLGFWT